MSKTMKIILSIWFFVGLLLCIPSLSVASGTSNFDKTRDNSNGTNQPGSGVDRNDNFCIGNSDCLTVPFLAQSNTTVALPRVHAGVRLGPAPNQSQVTTVTNVLFNSWPQGTLANNLINDQWVPARFVNYTSDKALFVPQKTASELASFFNNLPTGVIGNYAIANVNGYDVPFDASIVGAATGCPARDSWTPTGDYIVDNFPISARVGTTGFSVLPNSKAASPNDVTASQTTDDNAQSLEYTYTRDWSGTANPLFCSTDEKSNTLCAVTDFIQAHTLGAVAQGARTDKYYTWRMSDSSVLRVKAWASGDLPANSFYEGVVPDCSGVVERTQPLLRGVCGPATRRSERPTDLTQLCTKGNTTGNINTAITSVNVGGGSPWQWTCYDVKGTTAQTSGANCQSGRTLISSFTATPSITNPGNTTLTWVVSGAASCSIDQSIGDVAATGGNRDVTTPTTTTTYTLTCSAASGITDSQQVTVNASSAPGSCGGVGVKDVMCGDSLVDVICTPTQRLVTRVVQNVIGCSGIPQRFDYCIEDASCVLNTPPVINSFTANPTSVTSGSPSTLTWSVSGAASCSIDNGVGTVAASGGSTSVSPTATTTYTLTCTSPVGITATATASISVSVGTCTLADGSTVNDGTTAYSLWRPSSPPTLRAVGDGPPIEYIAYEMSCSGNTWIDGGQPWDCAGVPWTGSRCTAR